MQPYYGHMVRILHHCSDQTMTAALEKMELTAAQGRVMGFLAHCSEPPCPRDVEQAFQLSHPTVSGILSRLEQKGFVALKPDPGDKRCKRIHILPKGHECRELMHQTILANEERMVRNFTPEEREQFRSLLQRAASNMGFHPCHKRSKEEDSK